MIFQPGSDPDYRDWLPTRPGTMLEFQSTVKGKVPCWRCRFHLRWPPWRKHWLCRKPPRDIVYLDRV